MKAWSAYRGRIVCLSFLTCAFNGCDVELDAVERTQLPDSVAEARSLDAIVTNGDAEAGLWPWIKISAQLKRVSTEAYSGQWSLMLWERNRSWNGLVMPLGALEPSRRYEASVYVKLPAKATPSPMALELRNVVNDVEDIIQLAEDTPTPGQWTPLRGTFNFVPADGYAGSVLAIIAEDPDVTFFVDYLDVVDVGAADDAPIAPEQQAKPDLALNGGAEQGLDFWGLQAARIEHVSTPVRSGEGSVRVFERLEGWSGPTMRFMELEEGKQYLFSVYVRLAPGNPPTTAKLTVKSRIDGNDFYVSLGQAVISEGKWHRLAGVYQHIGSNGLEEIYAYIEATPTEVEFYVDDFQVEPAR